MAEVSTIGLDIAKHVFQAHGADSSGRVLFRRKMARMKLMEFFSSQLQCLVALEACGGAHHWGRQLAKLVTRSDRPRKPTTSWRSSYRCNPLLLACNGFVAAATDAPGGYGSVIRMCLPNRRRTA